MRKNVKHLVPAHYSQQYPRFIQFLEKYYEWLHRSSGLSDVEVDQLKADTSWIERDIDRFIATGKLRYMNLESEEDVVESSLVELNNTLSPGELSNRLSDKFLMDEDFKGFLTADGTPFADADDISFELNTVENNILDGWYNSMGLDRIKRRRLTSLNSLDQVLLLSLLKHIYGIKGTEASMKLFFYMFFGDDIRIIQPKQLVSYIDGGFTLDTEMVLRDDETFQEYSYIIITPAPLIKYKEVFNTIYMNAIHPSGFRVAVVHEDDYIEGMQIHDSGYINVPNEVYEDAK